MNKVYLVYRTDIRNARDFNTTPMLMDIYSTRERAEKHCRSNICIPNYEYDIEERFVNE